MTKCNIESTNGRVTEPSVLSNLREKRVAAQLSQAALAERVGVSRQAILAIEADRQVPSTELALLLARELRCSVEELFELARPEVLSLSYSDSFTGRVLLGQVDEKWVAHPLQSGNSGGDGVVSKVVGREEVRIEPLFALSELSDNVLVAGCAPLLGVLGASTARRAAGGRSTWISVNSMRALELLSTAQVHVAGVHLVSTDDPNGHANIVKDRFPEASMTVINLTRFRQGLVVQRGNPRGIFAVTDFLRADVRAAFRQAGSGAQTLLQHLLQERGICFEEQSHGPLARGHLELASWVRQGLVDVGIAIEPVAVAEGLDFIPLAEERFDLVLPSTRLAQEPVQRFLGQIEARAFKIEVAHIPGYDMTTAGHVTTVSA